MSASTRRNVDFLVIGAGVVGLAVALELKKRYPDQSVLVLEKEPSLALHSSGRNSGVLHSGIYYAPSSLKAKVCAQGAKELAEFCRENGLPIVPIGKILLPSRQEDVVQLALLTERAKANGVRVESLDSQQLAEFEPEAKKPCGDKALFVPDTAVVDPKAVMTTLATKLRTRGVEIRCGCSFISVDKKAKRVDLTDDNSISYGHVINAAGLHADRVAHMFDVGRRYTLLPFKGIYYKLDPNAGFRIRHLIYPVPDLRVPFLGVHTTTTVSGTTYVGPTAIPAFGRENYNGLHGISTPEALRITGLLVRQFYSGVDGFRQLAWQESRRYFKPWFVKATRELLPRVSADHLQRADKVGIRAQMLDLDSGKLVMDFLIEKGSNSTHILNAISPAFTSAFPFARFVLDQYIEKNGQQRPISENNCAT